MAIVPSEPIQQTDNSPDWIPPYTQLAIEYPYTPYTPEPSAPAEADIDFTTGEPLFATETFGPQTDNGLRYLQKAIDVGGYVVGGILFSKFGQVLGKVAKVGKKWFVTSDTASEMPKKTTPRRKQNKVPKMTPKKAPLPLVPSQPVYSKPVNVSAPVNISRRVNVKSKPMLRGSSRGLVVTHREMIGQIISSATTLAYNTNQFVINPGKFSTFPWLSSMAVNFDKYIMRKLRFSTISNQATTVAGRVGLGFDVDSTDDPPSDRNEFFALTYHAECSPWDTVVLDIPCDNKERFVNSHTTTDSKLIDVGQIVFMSDAIVATSTALSDVIVEYTVELLDPQQAVYATQYFSANNTTITTLDNLVTYGPAICQVGVTGMPYACTSTILYLKVQQGYYQLSCSLYDQGSGSPTVAVALHGGEGFGLTGNTTTVSQFVGNIKVTTNDSWIRLTFGTVAVSDLEYLSVALTRVSATTYVKSRVGGQQAYPTAIGTF